MWKIILLLYSLIPTTTLAAVASTNYVKGAIDTRVGIDKSTNQTLAGTYNVSGTMTVPTPPLPEISD